MIGCALAATGCTKLSAEPERDSRPFARIVSLDSNQASGELRQSDWLVRAGDVDPRAEMRVLREAGESGDGRDDVRWSAATVPGNLVTQGVVTDGRTPAWYRKTFVVPANVTAPLALRLDEISDRDRVYLNGRLFGSTGVWDSPAPQGYDRHRLYTIPDGMIRKGEVNLLLVQVKGFFPYESGILRNTTALGPAEAMWRVHYLSNFGAVLLLTVYATVAG